jgi:hypothetical protein
MMIFTGQTLEFRQCAGLRTMLKKAPKSILNQEMMNPASFAVLVQEAKNIISLSHV